MCTVVFVNVVDQNVDLGMCADSRLFIKCLLIVVSCSIVFVASLLVFLSFVFHFFQFGFRPRSRRFGAVRSEVLDFFFLPIIYFGFDSSGRCHCSDIQVFLISTVVEDGGCGGGFTAHLNLSIRRGALFPLLGFQLSGTDEALTQSSSR